MGFSVMLPSKNYRQQLAVGQYTHQEINPHFFFLKSFISPAFTENFSHRRFPSRIPIISAIKLGTPDLDDMHKTL